MTSVLAVVLIIVIFVLIIILALETIEYRRSKEYSKSLEQALIVYSQGHNALVSTMQQMQESFDQAIEEHNSLAKDMDHLTAILEIHHRALLLNPKILGREKSIET